MPAEKSKNSFPSTSVTTMPRPCFATSGYDRVYEGEMYLLSPSRTRLALGPGKAVLSLGPVRVWVDIASSKMVVGRSSWVVGFERSSALKSESDEEDGKTNRYRIGWDAPATATLPDNDAGTRENGASTRAGA